MKEEQLRQQYGTCYIYGNEDSIHYSHEQPEIYFTEIGIGTE
eukprot:CAMPEP_0196243740 /NCGR_PEP_ID=MMETSP0913-20130531/28814_1 /TAXON_ID=49265 /ORGANISM="Thalassiosira rotula, Strain GSO102" /LENGTH=41 /DNA_ID= /DNA_START= /DNA_END= /DNA_ORIENTATION=